MISWRLTTVNFSNARRSKNGLERHPVISASTASNGRDVRTRMVAAPLKLGGWRKARALNLVLGRFLGATLTVSPPRYSPLVKNLDALAKAATKSKKHTHTHTPTRTLSSHSQPHCQLSRFLLHPIALFILPPSVLRSSFILRNCRQCQLTAQCIRILPILFHPIAIALLLL